MSEAMRVTILCFLFSFLFAIPLLGDVQQELRLEGVLFDSSNPEDSIAVLNGNYLKTGEKFGPYRIADIQRKFIRVVDEETGKETTLLIQRAAPLPSPSVEVETVDAERMQTERNWFENLKANITSFFQEWNPSNLINKFWELKASLDLARIYNAAVNYHNKNGVMAWEIAQLVRAKYLPESFNEEARGKYHFYLNEQGKSFGVFADPIETESGLRYFYVGEDAVIRVEEGKQAGPESTPHDY